MTGLVFPRLFRTKPGAWLVSLLLLPGVWAAELPPDAAVDRGVPTMTLTPQVVVHSGRLEWEPFSRDLSAWPTLSHADRRSTEKPRRVSLTGPLEGDATRGRELAMRRDKGFCMLCHQLPGEQWSGNFGISLLGYRLNHHADADLYQQVFDPRVNNPHTAMPPYGTNRILSDQEIRDIVAYLQSLE
ncbi:MAG TPA: sulfur oxidation c-type cytochrome SoxX [Thiobacillaceae bacterium]|nr:sulfur oxidation c-type cytochrome SoxX [Thiobacillaceae bacterium]HNU65169.1 sulfur oxidation c-type cytochrome SoxX [Thiobacillaceae bacterium]